MCYLGVDLGSLSCDAVLMGPDGMVLAAAVVPTGARNQEAVHRVVDAVLKEAKIAKDRIRAIVATGYGRAQVAERRFSVTEITCHARGVEHHFPGTQVLIDIGGQDSKVIRLDGTGRVVEFAMNDKCAAGTGRFLEAMARALQVEIEDLGGLDRGASGRFTLSSMCTVFAESEVVSLIAEGAAVSEIASGLNRSIASRTVALVKRVAPRLNGLQVAMSGGVAHNRGVVRALEAALGTALRVPAQPDTVGALGAAILAKERARGSPAPAGAGGD
ncbi:MAG: acyl-CoA dehydratase activase [Desulfosarcinaceae bacterium]